MDWTDSLEQIIHIWTECKMTSSSDITLILWTITKVWYTTHAACRLLLSYLVFSNTVLLSKPKTVLNRDFESLAFINHINRFANRKCRLSLMPRMIQCIYIRKDACFVGIVNLMINQDSHFSIRSCLIRGIPIKMEFLSLM